ncbi:MAG: hypothetical protein ACK5BB_02055, partial [Burkholderiaceae bacterium]
SLPIINDLILKSMKSTVFIDFQLLNSQWLWITHSDAKSSPTSVFHGFQHSAHTREGKNPL